MAKGLQRKDRVQLFGGIVDVDALVAGQAIRNPIQPMQAHDMVNTEQARVSQMIADNSNEVLVAVQPHGLGMHRRKTPVLTFCKYRVRRCSSRDTANEKPAIAPDVVALGM